MTAGSESRVNHAVAELRPRLKLPPVALLIGISALAPIAINGVLPANSAIMAEMGTSYAWVQGLLTVFLLANLMAQSVFGALADRYGRRPIMLIGLTLFSFGSGLCLLADSIEWLLLGRYVQGFGGAVCFFLPRTIVRDVYDQDRAASAIGYLTTAMMLAPMFGPALGGWLTDQADWRWIHALLMIGAALVALCCWAFQNETAPAIGQASTARGGFRLLLGEPRFVGLALIMAGSVGVYYCFLAGAPYVMMESRGYSASTFGGWFAAVALGYLSGNLVAGKLSMRMGTRRMICWGLVPGAVGVVLFWALSGLDHPAAMVMPMQLVAFTNGLTLPNVSSAAMSVRASLAASASGLAGSFQIGSGIVLTLVLGIILPHSDLWLYTMMSASTLLAAIGLRLYLRAA